MSISTNFSDKPLYYQGKFMPGNSLSSETGLSAIAIQPGIYGTLKAADAVSRGNSLQDSLRETDRGVFNLPRYYPKYQTYRSGSRNSGGAKPSEEFYGDVFFTSGKNSTTKAKSNKLRKKATKRPTNDSEVFTVVDGFDTMSLEERQRKTCFRREVVFIAIGILALCLIGIAIFLGVYLSRSSSSTVTATVTPVTATVTPAKITLLFQSTLKINATFIPAYNNLSDPATVQLTSKLCSALEQSLSNINTSSSVPTWGNNCSAVNYTSGSIVCVMQFAMNASSTTNADNITNAINSTLTSAMSASNNGGGPFFSIFNTTVANVGTSKIPPVATSVATSPSTSPTTGSTVVSPTSLPPSSNAVTSNVSTTQPSVPSVSIANTSSIPPVTGSTEVPPTSLSSSSIAVTSTASTTQPSTPSATTSPDHSTLTVPSSLSVSTAQVSSSTYQAATVTNASSPIVASTLGSDNQTASTTQLLTGASTLSELTVTTSFVWLSTNNSSNSPTG